MKYIHLFESKDAYDAAKKGLILPRVSYIKEKQDVKYNPFNANGHDYVEIAGIKWATMNVGANDVTDYGLYFQWGDIQGYTANQVTGDTEPKKAFSWSDYKFTTDGGKSFTKYNGTDGKTVLDLEDDAVHAAWGGSWRMPTKEEFVKLRDAVTTEFVTDYKNSGVNGLLCTANDGSNKTLFFPACGSANDGSMYVVGSEGRYWSSSLYSSLVGTAYSLDFLDGDVYWQNNFGRCDGFAVRGVLAEN